MTSQAALDDYLEERDLPSGSVLLASEPTPGAEAPPEGLWLIMPYGNQFLVGAMARGQFVLYGTVWTWEDAQKLAARLVTPAPMQQAADKDAVAAQGRRTAEAIADRTRARGGAAGPTAVATGDAVDNIGPESGRHLYALGTPFPARSQPPTDIGATLHRYLVTRPLPSAVNEGVAAPWFGQPGGGSMIVLDRPIRWYVDNNYLAEVTVA